jgi:hypothetical protein
LSVGTIRLVDQPGVWPFAHVAEDPRESGPRIGRPASFARSCASEAVAV